MTAALLRTARGRQQIIRMCHQFCTNTVGICCREEGVNEDELQFEYLIKKEKLSISVLTWNVDANSAKTLSIDSLLKHENFNTDIYVIGLQEIIDLNATNMILLNNNKAFMEWKNKIEETLNSASTSKKKYIHLRSINLCGISLLIFVKQNIRKHVRNIMAAKCATGMCGIGPNKGAVGIRLDIDDTSICFICCHLAAHKHKLKERNANYNKIIQNMVFKRDILYHCNLSYCQSCDAVLNPMLNMVCSTCSIDNRERINILDHDVVFMFGDLNYRLQFDHNDLNEVYRLIKQKNWNTLLSNDQLIDAMNNDDVFKGFNEYKIDFQPTFKFEPGTNKYDQIKKRIPSYCDRILWKVQTDKNMLNQVGCLKYDTDLSYKISDHKPVVGLYNLGLM